MIHGRRERTEMLGVTSTVLFFAVLVWFNYSAVLPASINAPLELPLKLDRI